jgi:hypothetical protein
VSTSSHKIPQFTRKVPTSSHKIPQFTQKVPTSSQKVKKYTQKIPQSFTPKPMSSPYKQFSTLHSLTDAERAMIYARRNPQHKSIANLQKRKMECQYRGMMYNPITKQCTLKSRPSFRGCKEDCARIGKRCGPRGTCIKL